MCASLKAAGGQWVFATPTISGHMEPSSLKKQHPKAIQQATALFRRLTRRNALSPRVRTLHLAAYMLDPMGTAHGPLNPGIPSWAPRHEHHEALRSPSRTDHPCGDGSHASGEQRANYLIL